MVDLRDHPRWITTVVGAPAAGADLSFRVPSGNILAFGSALITLTTGAAVANRVMITQISDGTRVYLQHTAPVSQVASTTRTYSFLRGVNLASPPGGTIPIPIDALEIPIYPGHVIQTAVENLQAADQLSAIVFRTLAYPDGPRVSPIVRFNAAYEPIGEETTTVPSIYTP